MFLNKGVVVSFLLVMICPVSLAVDLSTSVEFSGRIVADPCDSAITEDQKSLKMTCWINQHEFSQEVSVDALRRQQKIEMLMTNVTYLWQDPVKNIALLSVTHK